MKFGVGKAYFLGIFVGYLLTSLSMKSPLEPVFGWLTVAWVLAYWPIASLCVIISSLPGAIRDGVFSSHHGGHDSHHGKGEHSHHNSHGGH